jgi:hypothetical protein
LEIECAEDRDVAHVADIDQVVIIHLFEPKIGLPQFFFGCIPDEVVVNLPILIFVAKLCLLSHTNQAKFGGLHFPHICN